MQEDTSETAAGSARAIARVGELTAGLAFAPLPDLLTSTSVTRGWRPLAALDLRPDATDDHSVARVLAAERSDGTPAGPHAVHGLRSLARELIFSTAASLYLVGQVTAFDPSRWCLRRSGDGPGATRHGLLVRDPDVGRTDAAAALVTTLTPVVTAVRDQTRVGRRTLWGYVIDMSRFAMITLARQLGRDRAEAWQESHEWAEALYEAGAPRLSEPRLAVYSADHEDGTWAIRGACCLDFVDPDHGYCVTCPVLDHDSRAARWLNR